MTEEAFEKWVAEYFSDWSNAVGPGIIGRMRDTWNAATKNALANQHRILTCVYCGHQYPQGTPPASAEVLTEHIKSCPEHPMRKLQEQLDAKEDPRDHDPRCRLLCGPEPSRLKYEDALTQLRGLFDQLLDVASTYLEASRHDNPDEEAAVLYADATEARFAEIEQSARRAIL